MAGPREEHKWIERLLHKLATRLPCERVFSEERAESIRRQLRDSVESNHDELPRQASSDEDRGVTS